MEINVLFFGEISGLTGVFQKHYRSVSSFSDLLHRIEDDFPEIIHYPFRIAVNNQIINNEPELNCGDEVAFLPPFYGD